jgi:hypothetical protein
MARVYLLTKPKLTDRAYTVDQAVGQGCPNRRDDVLLVQFLLRVAREDAPDSPGYRPPGQPPIAIDGHFGPGTLAHLRFFEEEGNRRNPENPTVPDGRIDPVASGTPVGSLSGKLYKIFALNVLYVKRRGAAVHADMRRDPLYPAELTKSLYIDL